MTDETLVSDMEVLYNFASRTLREFYLIENNANFISLLQDNDLYYDFDRAYRNLEHIKEYASAFLYTYDKEMQNVG